MHWRTSRMGDWESVLTLLRQGAFVGGSIMAPAAATTLITGLFMVFQAGFSFTFLWVAWGLVGLIVSWFVLSVALIRRSGIAMGRLAQEVGGNDQRVHALHRRMVRLSMINLLVLFSVLIVMIVKPA